MTRTKMMPTQQQAPQPLNTKAGAGPDLLQSGLASKAWHGNCLLGVQPSGRPASQDEAGLRACSRAAQP